MPAQMKTPAHFESLVFTEAQGWSFKMTAEKEVHDWLKTQPGIDHSTDLSGKSRGYWIDPRYDPAEVYAAIHTDMEDHFDFTLSPVVTAMKGLLSPVDDPLVDDGLCRDYNLLPDSDLTCWINVDDVSLSIRRIEEDDTLEVEAYHFAKSLSVDADTIGRFIVPLKAQGKYEVHYTLPGSSEIYTLHCSSRQQVESQLFFYFSGKMQQVQVVQDGETVSGVDWADQDEVLAWAAN